jgi:hypothetical protein
MAVVARNATFSFSGFSGQVTDISVQSPSAEIVDMSSTSNISGAQVLVPTGGLIGGSISVGFMSTGSGPEGLVGKRASLLFSATGYSVTRNVILESANVDVRLGEVIRGSMKFRITDYYGN